MYGDIRQPCRLADVGCVHRSVVACWSALLAAIRWRGSLLRRSSRYLLMRVPVRAEYVRELRDALPKSQRVNRIAGLDRLLKSPELITGYRAEPVNLLFGELCRPRVLDGHLLEVLVEHLLIHDAETCAFRLRRLDVVQEVLRTQARYAILRCQLDLLEILERHLALVEFLGGIHDPAAFGLDELCDRGLLLTGWRARL